MGKLFTLSLIGSVCLASFIPSYGQIRYDNGGIGSSGSSSARTSFVLDGRRWDCLEITYMFMNGTADIANNDERAAVRQAFALWQNATYLTFREVTVAADADIRILWGADNHGDPFPFDNQNGVLAHAFFPPPNNGALAGDMHFDEDENWTTGTRSSGSQPIDLVTVAAHEIGHSLGLDHTDVAGSLMLANYTGSHRFLGPDDIAGIRTLYGGPRSINGASATTCSANTTYTLQNPPPGTNVTWRATPTIAFTVSNGNGTTANLRSATSARGTGTLVFTINDGCGTTTVSRTVAYGSPAPASLTPSSKTVFESQSVQINASPTASRWTVSSGLTIISSSSTRIIVKASRPGAYSVYAYRENSCGSTSSVARITVRAEDAPPPPGCAPNCPDNPIVVYPNPVDKLLTVALEGGGLR